MSFLATLDPHIRYLDAEASRHRQASTPTEETIPIKRLKALKFVRLWRLHLHLWVDHVEITRN